MSNRLVPIVVLALFVIGPQLGVLAADAGATGPVSTAKAVSVMDSRTAEGATSSDLYAMPVSSLSLGAKAASDQVPSYRLSSRAGSRAGPDVTPYNITFNSTDRSWFGYSVGTVGTTTSVSAYITNLGDTNATNVNVRIDIKDHFAVVIDSFTGTIADIPPGEAAPLVWQDWAPKVSQKVSAMVTSTVAGDADATNNVWTFYGSGWWVDKWLDMADIDTNWTGDISATEWHVTDSVYLDPRPDGHSDPNVFYAGTETLLSDFYTPNMNVSLISKSIDLKRMNPSYGAYLNFKYYGATVAGVDDLRIYISLDDGATWVDTRTVITGVSSIQGGATWLHRIDNWVDLNNNGAMDTGEYDIGMDISEYSGHDIKVKFTFRSGPTSTGQGYYIDDVIVYGYEGDKEVAVSRIDDLGTTHFNETETVTATLVNLGVATSPGLTARMRVHNSTGVLVHQEEQSVSPIAPGAEFKASWDYTFDTEGDFWVVTEILQPPQGTDGSTNNNWQGRRVHVSSGFVGVLLVDDDGGATNSGRLHYFTYDSDTDWAIVKALEANRVQFDVTHVLFSSSGPDISVLKRYHTVIWSTGWDGTGRSIPGTLTAADRDTLTQYMDNGGSLWYISQETIFDLTGTGSSFLPSMLHVTSGGDDAGFPSVLEGVSGNEVLGAVSYEGTTPIPANDRTDSLSPDNQAHGMTFQSESVQNPSTGPFNGIFYNGSYKLVYTGFDLTYLKKEGDRAAFAGAIVRWLYSGLSLKVDDQTKDVDAGGSVNYTFTVTNHGAANKTVRELIVMDVSSGWEATITPLVSGDAPKVPLAGYNLLTGTLSISAPSTAPPDSLGKATIRVVVDETGERLDNITSSIVQVTPRLSISVSPSDQVGDAGRNASYLVTLVNTGNIRSTVNLTVEGVAMNWASFESSYLVLSPGEDDGSVLTVSVPMDAEAGNYSFDIIAEGRYHSTVMTASGRVNLTVKVFRALSIASVRSPDGGRVDPNHGQTDIFVEVDNRGNGKDDIKVALSGTFADQEKWTWDEQTVSIPAFSKAIKVGLNLTVWDQAEGKQYNVTVTATSQDGKTVARGFIIITVLRPDLYLSQDGISLDYDLVVGAETAFSVKVFNGGPVDSPVPNLTVYDKNNEKVFSGKAGSSIKAGGFSEVQVKWTPQYKGPEELTFVVNDGNGIIESAYENNSITKSVIVLQPNLKVEEKDILFYIQGKEAKKATVGALITITVQVNNMDTYAYKAPDVVVEFYIDGKKIGNKTVNVQSGDIQYVRAEWKAVKGTHTVSIKVDPANEVLEQSEQDNQASRQIVVKQKPAGLLSVDPLFIGVAVGLGVVLLIGYGLARGVIPSPIKKSRVETADKAYVCNECKKPIKKGTRYYHCTCGRRAHTKCAKKAELCECLRRVRLDE